MEKKKVVVCGHAGPLPPYYGAQVWGRYMSLAMPLRPCGERCKMKRDSVSHKRKAKLYPSLCRLK